MYKFVKTSYVTNFMLPFAIFMRWFRHYNYNSRCQQSKLRVNQQSAAWVYIFYVVSITQAEEHHGKGYKPTRVGKPFSTSYNVIGVRDYVSKKVLI